MGILTLKPKNSMKLWIARDTDGYLHGFEKEPTRNAMLGTFSAYPAQHYSIDKRLFPEITWENSPIRVEIKYKKAGKVRCTEKQIEQALYWQRKYDELNADCKDLLSAVANLVQTNGRNTDEPTFLQFNEDDGYPSHILSLIRNSGLWEFRRKWIEAKKPKKDDKNKIELDGVISDIEYYAKREKSFRNEVLWSDILRKLNVIRYDL